MGIYLGPCPIDPLRYSMEEYVNLRARQREEARTHGVFLSRGDPRWDWDYAQALASLEKDLK